MKSTILSNMELKVQSLSRKGKDIKNTNMKIKCIFG